MGLLSSLSSFMTGGGLDVLGTAADVFGTVMNYKAVQKTNDMNYKIFREGLEYNKPINQMKRFQEAGLNPNLMYSQGNAGNATALPTMKAPQMDFDFVQKLSTIYGIKNMKEQNKNLQEQNTLLQSQASVATEQKRKLELENNFFETHGYWPSEEAGFARSSRQLLDYLGFMINAGRPSVGNVPLRVRNKEGDYVYPTMDGRYVPVRY